MTQKTSVTLFRWMALAEAISYLLLLGIAMPLKYVWDMPLAVKWVGAAHGALFVTFCLSLAFAMYKAAWPLSRAVLLFIASLIPLLPFWLDAKVKAWAEES
jgi:integral membrane protein